MKTGHCIQQLHNQCVAPLACTCECHGHEPAVSLDREALPDELDFSIA